MEWTCTECGKTATADAVDLSVQGGWWITEPGRGLCPACARKEVEASGAETVERAHALRDEARKTRRAATTMLAGGYPAARTPRA